MIHESMKEMECNHTTVLEVRQHLHELPGLA